MKRDVSRLSRKGYDLAIVGGGIYGISVARDAALPPLCFE
jgi:glycerol-3-phosphate dehydrogenase